MIKRTCLCDLCSVDVYEDQEILAVTVVKPLPGSPAKPTTRNNIFDGDFHLCEVCVDIIAKALEETREAVGR